MKKANLRAFSLCSGLCSDWSRHQEIRPNGGVKSISKVTCPCEKKRLQSFLMVWAKEKKNKCITRTFNSFVNYYSSKYLLKVSPYVKSWHMLQFMC